MSTEPVTVQPSKQMYLREFKSAPAISAPDKKDSVEKQPAAKNKNPSNSSSPVAVSGARNSNKDSLEKILGEVTNVVVSQNVEKIETATAWLTLGCCKVETENRYELLDLDTRKTLFVADEESIWCLRNPCICCDCICWCCHSDCATRRAFSMNLTAGSLEGPLILEMDRPCRSDCMPCCLQKISVSDKTSILGTVKQKVHCVPPCTMCGKFEVTNSNGEVIYTINTPCVLTTCCCTEVAFNIKDKEGNEVGEIAKQSANVAKETFTDSDRFVIKFPADCSVQMKAVLIGALFLFDYLFYED